MSDVGSDGAASSKYWDPKKSLSAIVVCVLIGLAVVLIQASQLGTLPGFVGQAAIMLAVSGAAVMLGGLVGFLFGIPRRLQNGERVKEQAETVNAEQSEGMLYEGNTNLEQISDWLTKIIVGVTLVKLADIVTELEKYGDRIATATGRPSDAAFSVGLIIFFFICGFLTGYLWSRLFLGRALSEAESRIRLQKKLDKLQQQAQADAEAITLARRQLSQEETSKPTVQEIAKAISEASYETVSHVFSLAENNRWRNWESNKNQMERSIPIFEALILRDTEGKYHRNVGQLAYCLKDKNSPDLEAAEKLFTRAITIRGEAEGNGWAAYEANRAIVRIKLGEAMAERFGSKEELKKAIQSDLEIALKDYWVAEWLKKDTTVLEWSKKNDFRL
jgi:tetratricopeptide (TPR) repeat protein